MKKIQFFNNAVKQGNSLCIRIPYKIVRELNIRKNSTIGIGDIVNMDNEIKKIPLEAINSYKKVMKKFSTDEIRQFLNYHAIEQTSGEKLKINKKYEQFKKFIGQKKNKELIKKELKKTKYWKEINKKE